MKTTSNRVQVPTVTPQKRQELMERYQRSRSIEDRNAVVEASIPLVIIVTKRFVSIKGSELAASEFDELFCIGSMALLSAVASFDPAKGKFSTYSGRAMFRAMEREWTKDRSCGVAQWRHRTVRSLQEMKDATNFEPERDDGDMISAHSAQWATTVTGRLFGFLNERQCDILRLMHVDGLSSDKSGEVLHVSGSRVRQVSRMAIDRLVNLSLSIVADDREFEPLFLGRDESPVVARTQKPMPVATERRKAGTPCS